MSLDPFEIEFDGSDTSSASSVSSTGGRNGDEDSLSEPPIVKIAILKSEDGDEDSGIPNDKESEDDEESEDSDYEYFDDSYRELRAKQRAEQGRINAILEQFTPEQMDRYESYRRSRFKRASMRKLLQEVAGGPVSLKMTTLMSGIAKIYVGDLVETSRIIMAQRNVKGPIRPCDLREAHRKLELEGKVPKLHRHSLFQS